MKITSLKSTVVKGYGDWILVEVETDAKLTGVGECFPSLARGAGPTVEAIRVAARILKGEDPREVNRLWTHLYDYFLGRPGSTAGLVTTVLSGIETALLDLLGKSLETPVYRLLGGKYRSRIRLYADCGAGENGDPKDYAKRARKAVMSGFTAVKIDAEPNPFPHIHRPQDWYEDAVIETGLRSAAELNDSYSRSLSNDQIREIVARVKAVRDEVGPKVEVCVDTPGYTVESAVRLARALEPFQLFWLEDPLPRESTAPIIRLKQASSTPVLTGECLFTRFGFKNLLEAGAVDIIAPDVQKTGGILETRRIADLASLQYVPIAPHCVSSPVGTAAAAHLCAAVPNFLILEFHALFLPYWGDLISSPSRFLDNGYLRLPEGPGLGVELNWKALKSYAREGEAFRQ